MANRTEKTTAEWRQLARVDPLYVIATRPGKEGSWEREEFYATGRSDWSDFRRHWRHYEPGLGGTCLEIGCGAGRVTHALALDFDRVVALDVSADMLELAREVAPENVDLRRVSGTEIPLSDASLDAVFTCHVLQHLEGLDVVGEYLAEARRVLRPGGTLMMQLGLHSSPMRLHGRIRAELRLWAARRARARGARELTFRTRLYRREEVTELLEGLGFVEIELRVFSVRSSAERHAFWLARRPAWEDGIGHLAAAGR
jgi:SAM-dependent methyltransferase